SMSHTTVFIIMDAGRSDYVRPDSMPFLSGLAKRGISGEFESPPGFAQRTVLFSGRYPDTSGNFSAFVFDPAASPFRWVRHLGPLGALVKPRKVSFPARLAIDRITKWKTGAYHTDPAWIPPRYLPFFRPCEDMRPMFDEGALGAPSIFDLARANGRTFRYLAHPVSGNDDEVHAMLVRELRQGAPCDLFVAQFSVLDQQGHVHGPFSPAMQKGYLRTLDDRLASVHAALGAGYDSWDLFVCGDHGMGPVSRQVDVLGALEAARAAPGKDYVVFVNSTIALLWYLNDRGRQEVEAVLPRIPGTQILSDEERKRLRIPTDRRWGDRLIVADPGVLFWPDSFHVVDSRILGMHGYIDKEEEAYGAAVRATSADRASAREVGRRPLVDVFPTLCDLLGVPVPPGQEGSSLLAGAPRVRPLAAARGPPPAPPAPATV
ncbi:MAG: alkaline phosphatase family protein, partial [Methanobacteriota archaeon]